MSDSQFLRFQNLMKDKYKKMTAQWDKSEKSNRKFKLKQEEPTFLDKIGSWLKLK